MFRIVIADVVVVIAVACLFI